MSEEWKIIPETNGDYSVSSMGRVRSNGFYYNASNGTKICTFNRKPRVLKPSKSTDGYLQVELHGKTVRVHRLVATAFIGNPNNKPCINHKDGNKENNTVENLEWVTVAENNLHALSTGLRPRGEQYPYAKLTESQVREIRQNHKPKTVGCGCKVLARKYGVHHSVIQNILNGKKWRSVQ